MSTFTQQQAANNNPLPCITADGDIDFLFETRIIEKLYRLGRPCKEIYEVSRLSQADVNTILDVYDTDLCTDQVVS